MMQKNLKILPESFWKLSLENTLISSEQLKTLTDDEVKMLNKDVKNEWQVTK